MEASPAIALPLLQGGLLLAGVLIAQLVAVRHLPVEDIPGVIRHRVEVCSRLRPWLFATAAAMVAVGLALLGL